MCVLWRETEVITKAVNASRKVGWQTAKVSCQGKCGNGGATYCLNQRVASGSVGQTWGVSTCELSSSSPLTGELQLLIYNLRHLLLSGLSNEGFRHVEEDNLHGKHTMGPCLHCVWFSILSYTLWSLGPSIWVLSPSTKQNKNKRGICLPYSC